MKAMLPTKGTRADYDRLIRTPGWFVSAKHDGHRLVYADGVFLNRHGDPYKHAVPADVQAFAGLLPDTLPIDGELADGIWHVFDVPCRGYLTDRLRMVDMVAELADINDFGHAVKPVGHYRHDQVTNDLVDQWLAGEGVVFKKAESFYRPGKSSNWVKVKFVHQVDVIVTAKGIDGKDNLELSVWRDGALTEVGHCSALTGDGPLVEVDDVVTVTVHSVTNGGRLREPVTPRLRRGEVQPDTCTWENLHA